MQFSLSTATDVLAVEEKNMNQGNQKSSLGKLNLPAIDIAPSFPQFCSAKWTEHTQ